MLRRLMAVVGLAFAVLIGSGVPAMAASDPEAVPVAQGSDAVTIDEGTGGEQNACGVGEGASDDDVQNYLPVNRWAASTALFPTNPERGLTDITTLVQESSTQMFGGTLYGVSSAVWGLNVTAADLGMRFCPLEHMGFYVDNLIGEFGGLILDAGAGLIVGVLVVTIVGVIFQGRRSGSFDVKMLAGKAAAVGALVVMTIGATNASGGDGDDYQPVWYSPGGIITTLNNVSTTLGTGLVENTMETAADGMDEIMPGADSADEYPAHCQNMIDAGHEAYSMEAGAGGSLIGGLSQTWTSTVYASWTRALLADDYAAIEGESGHGFLPCRIAEWNSTMPLQSDDVDSTDDDGATVLGAWDRSNYAALGFVYGNDGELDGDSSDNPLAAATDLYDEGELPWTDGSGVAPIIDTAPDQQMYAALTTGVCHQAGFTSGGGNNFDDIDENPEFNGVFEGTRIIDHLGVGDSAEFDPGDAFESPSFEGEGQDWHLACELLYTSTGSADENPVVNGEMPIHGNAEDIRAGMAGYEDGPSPSPQGATAMLAFMTGENVGGSTVEGIGAGLVSVSVMLILIPVLVVLMLVRLLMVFLMFGLFLALVAGLLPGKSFEPFVRILKMTVGVVLLSMFVQVIFALIMAIMLMLNDLGAGIVDPGTISFAFWAGITPWLAVLGLHFTFKFLKIPSPLKMSAAMEWGNAMSKQGADSVGSKLGGAGGGAGDKAKSMAGQAKSKLGGSGAGADPSSGAARQRSAEETEARPGSRRGALARATGAVRSARGATEQTDQAGAAAKQGLGEAKEQAKDTRTQQKADQKAERKAQRTAQKRQLKDMKSAEDGSSAEATAARTAAACGQHKRDRKLLADQQARGRDDLAGENASNLAGAQGAVAGVGQQRAENRQAARQDRRATKKALSQARKARRAEHGLSRGEGESKARFAARRLGSGAWRALSATNASEGLSKADMARRAAKIGGTAATITGVAALGGAPIAAAAAGTAVAGLGAGAVRRGWNSATSKRSGSVRDQASTLAAARGYENTLGRQRINDAVETYGERSGEGLNQDQSQQNNQETSSQNDSDRGEEGGQDTQHGGGSGPDDGGAPIGSTSPDGQGGPGPQSGPATVPPGADRPAAPSRPSESARPGSRRAGQLPDETMPDQSPILEGSRQVSDEGYDRSTRVDDKGPVPQPSEDQMKSDAETPGAGKPETPQDATAASQSSGPGPDQGSRSDPGSELGTGSGSDDNPAGH